MKANLRLVQFWTSTEKTDTLRLDSEILRLRDRVWERAAKDAMRQDLRAKMRTAGLWFMSAAIAVMYLWCLGR
jgi:hypothetical protein